jgi:20S proteasome alpha/beta subunit
MRESTSAHWDIYNLPNLDISAQTISKALMTFIMGARCNDGVVLIADTKVTLSDYSEFDYQKKLFDGIGHVIYGSSGSTSMYELFRGHVEDYVDTHPGEMNYRNAVIKLSRIAFKTIKRYSFHPDYYYDLLVALQPPDRDSTLTFISGRGAPQTIDGCSAIGIGQRFSKENLS